MKKVIWITPEGFLDVDMLIIKQLTSKFNIYWLIIGFGGLSKHMYAKPEVENFAKQNQIEYDILSPKYRFRNPLILFFYLSLIRKIRSFKTDILYTSYLGEPYFLHLLKIFFNRNKAVLAIHDAELHSSETKRHIKEMYHNYIKKHYINFHLFSDSQAKVFIQTFRNKNILLTPLCIKDFGQPSAVVKNEKTHFLFFGNILPYKGLEILIDAVNYLVQEQKIVDFSLTIAGNCSASDWNIYQKTIQHPEIIRAEIRTIKNCEIADLFCNSDYLILPYKDVTQCGPLMIAYNYKLPVIATDLPGFRDYIIEGETGFLFECNNYVKLAEIMAICIKTAKKDILAGNISKIVFERYKPAVISTQYAQYFNKLSV